jgi:hypothetical protein
MSKRYNKGRPKPSRRRSSEQTERAEVIAAIVQATTRCILDWFIDWISRGGRL